MNIFIISSVPYVYKYAHSKKRIIIGSSISWTKIPYSFLSGLIGSSETTIYSEFI